MSTTEIPKSINPDGFDENKIVAKKGGTIAGDARKNIENESGKKVITKQNAKHPKLLDDKKVQ